MEKTIYQYLKLKGIEPGRRYLYECLRSHPYYPSALSITDTLSHFGLEVLAVQIDKNDLEALPLPFLAHLKNAKEKNYVLIKNLAEIAKFYPRFNEEWDGLAIIAERPQQFKAREESLIGAAQEKQAAGRQILLAVLLGLAALGLLLHSSWPVELFRNVLLLAGLGISVLLVLQESGSAPAIAEKLCGKNSHCSEISSADTLRLPLSIRLTDLATSFFSGALLLAMISKLHPSTAFAFSYYSLLWLLAWPALLLLAFLLAYQAWVLKKWCRLCLLLSACMAAWALLQVITVRFYWPLALPESLFMLLLFILPGCSWLHARNWMETARHAEAERLELRTMKRHPALFSTYLLQQQAIPCQPLPGDLFIGNAEAPVQLLMACNPYCKPCAKAHQVLHRMLQTPGISFGLSIRFALGNDHPNDPHFRAAHYLLQLQYAYNTASIVEEWYRQPDPLVFQQRFPLNDPVSEQIQVLKQQKEWAEETDIEYTPTLFINGYRLKAPYQISDLPDLWNSIEEIFSPE